MLDCRAFQRHLGCLPASAKPSSSTRSMVSQSTSCFYCCCHLICNTGNSIRLHARRELFEMRKCSRVSVVPMVEPRHIARYVQKANTDRILGLGHVAKNTINSIDQTVASRR